MGSLYISVPHSFPQVLHLSALLSERFPVKYKTYQSNLVIESTITFFIKGINVTFFQSIMSFSFLNKKIPLPCDFAT